MWGAALGAPVGLSMASIIVRLADRSVPDRRRRYHDCFIRSQARPKLAVKGVRGGQPGRGEFRAPLGLASWRASVYPALFAIRT